MPLQYVHCDFSVVKMGNFKMKNEPRSDKTGYLHMRKQRRRSAAQLLISAFVFSTCIVQSYFYLNPKFKASSYLLWLHSLFCVGPGNTEDRFSHNEAQIVIAVSEKGGSIRESTIYVLEKTRTPMVL